MIEHEPENEPRTAVPDRHGARLLIASVLVGSLIMGHLLRQIDDHMHPATDSRLMFVFISVVVLIAKNENAVFETVVSLIQLGLVGGLLGRGSFRRVSSSGL